MFFKNVSHAKCGTITPMTTPEYNSMKPFKKTEESSPLAQEILSLSNEDILDFLEEDGALVHGGSLTPDDYSAVRARAVYLEKSTARPASINTLITCAYVDRMQTIGHLGDEQIKQMPDKVLKEILYVATGMRPTDEEISMLRSSPLAISKWGQERIATKIPETYVTVNGGDNRVIGTAHTQEEAMRKGREEQGLA